MNIVLVALDTVRADHLGCYGYPRATSPRLDAFARSAVRFERFYASAIPTTPSFTTLFTGQHAIGHGIVSHGGSVELDLTHPWLPSILREAGYLTAAVDNLATMKPWFRRGYDFYIDASEGKRHSHDVECVEVNRCAVPWLREHAEEKFFLFLHYWDVHTPYLPPERYRGLFYDGDPCDPSRGIALKRFFDTDFLAARWRDGWFRQLAPEGRQIADADYIRAMYDAEIRYLDDGAAELLGALDDAGLAGDTLVAFFADHGEEMYEHGVFFDHHGLYEGNIHVPLLIRHPGKGRPGTVVPDLVQHVDIAPTVLEAAGIDVPREMHGRSVIPQLAGECGGRAHDVLVASECTYQKKRAILADGWKLIVSLDAGPDLHGKPPRELYHIVSDPREQRNAAAERPDLVLALEERLADHVAAMLAKCGRAVDPLLEQDITLGKNWRRWLEEHRYW